MLYGLELPRHDPPVVSWLNAISKAFEITEDDDPDIYEALVRGSIEKILFVDSEVESRAQISMDVESVCITAQFPEGFYIADAERLIYRGITRRTIAFNQAQLVLERASAAFEQAESAL